MQPGHTERLAEVYALHRLALVAVAANILGCRHLAEDAVHDAFAKLVQNHGTISDPVAYCFQAVRNTALNGRRKNNSQQRGLELYQDLKSAEAAGSGNSPPIRNTEALFQLIDALSPDQRELVLLKTHANLTFVQIGEIQNVPMKTVATRYRRLIQDMKSKMENVHEV